MHHAYLYADSAQLPNRARHNGVDSVRVVIPVLDIGSVRKLIAEASQNTFAADAVRCVVVECDSIRTEAQNALLKFFEEPPTRTQVHIVVKNQSTLLPTLLSRVAKTEIIKEAVDTAIAQAFISAPISKRLEVIAEKTAGKDLEWQRMLLDGLEQVVTEKEDSMHEYAQELLFVRSQILAPGASAKMLLEHLALAYDELCK